jgi:uncharacterized membrane protein YdbT with pleckstrin-like domain
MSDSTKEYGKELWKGRPWILPYVAFRTALVLVFAIIILFIESSLGILYTNQSGLPVIYWTMVIFLVTWILLLSGLLILAYSNQYILRENNLEIKVGIFTTKNSIIVPTGFSDMEVIRSISSRIFNTGDIVIKTQSERDFSKKLVKVRDPIRIAKLIGDVMAKPFFADKD